MDVSKLIDKAQMAAERGNYDYAVALYLQLLELQPNHVEARKALRDVEVRRAQEQGVTGSTASGWLKGIGSFIAAQVLLALRKYERAMTACENFLKNDPYNATVQKTLASAAAKADHLDTAILVLENVRSRMGQPSGSGAQKAYIGVCRRLADLYIQAEKLPKADERLKEILNINPKDRDAMNLLRDVAARRSMAEGGWDKAGQKGGYREVLKSQQKAADLEQSHRDIRTDEDALGRIESVKKELAEDPQNNRLIIEVGDLYKMMQRWDDARTWYQKALDNDPNNFLVKASMGDLKLAEMDAQVRELENAGKKEEAAELTRKRMAFALEEYERRVQARPQDLPTRFRYGQILFQLRRYKDAAVQFQHASRDPKTRRPSLYRLGLCFMRQDLIDLAIEQFEKAVTGASVVDREVKSILYALGEAQEQQGRPDEALDAYKKIFEIDINFKDVSQKIQELYSQGVGQTS
ncbi:MAG: tetratricopeptide repeat protein [Planctomycetota bacterium]